MNQEIQLLKGDVAVVTAGKRIRADGVQAPLLARLALVVPSTASMYDLRDGNRDTVANTQQKISRLGKQAGLKIKHVGDGYQLPGIGSGDVDALRLMAAAQRDVSTLSREDLESALAEWNPGPPPELAGQPFFEPVHAAKAVLEREIARRRRILIVEDRVGEQLKQVLAPYKPHLITTVGEFWPLAPTLDENFDLALIDLHLGGGYYDQSGLEIAEYIAANELRLPAIIMTMNAIGDVAAIVDRLQLAAYVGKRGDDDKADFSEITAAVRRAFESSPDAIVLKRIWSSLPDVRAQAAVWSQFSHHHPDKLAREYDKLVEIVKGTSSAPCARAALREFKLNFTS